MALLFVVPSVLVSPAFSDAVVGCVANRSADAGAIGDNIGYACGAMPRFDCDTGIIKGCSDQANDVYSVADYVFSVFYEEMGEVAANCSWGGAAALAKKADWQALGVRSECVALADPTPPPAPDPACAAHPACSGLTGDCCPTSGGAVLGCCSSGQESCSNHPACASAGMTGDCCPTSSGLVLECCTPALPPVMPGDGDAVARWMNNLYTGYNPDDDTSPLGVTIQMHEDFNFYCGEGCFNGNADCRVSASIYNHRVMVTQKSNSIAITTVNAAGSGMLFNQTAVETKLAKCSYQFDGATFNRLNQGCGCGAGGSMDCDDPMSAFNNVDPESNKPATGSSPHVTRCSCESPLAFKATKTTDEQCYWKGPAFYLPDGASDDGTRKMLAQRVANSEGEEQIGNIVRVKNEFWNEVVIDGKVLLEELQRDAVRTIPAMVYQKGSAAAKEQAVVLAKEMASQYHLAAPVPVIAFDKEKDVSTGGPFVFEGCAADVLII